MEESVTTNKLAIASVVLAALIAPSIDLLGPEYIFPPLHLIPLFLPILPILLGIVALGQIRVSNGKQKGNVLAWIGIITAIIEFLITCAISVLPLLHWFVEAVT